jgi:hypothetical protein
MLRTMEYILQHNYHLSNIPKWWGIYEPLGQLSELLQRTAALIKITQPKLETSLYFYINTPLHQIHFCLFEFTAVYQR